MLHPNSLYLAQSYSASTSTRTSTIAILLPVDSTTGRRTSDSSSTLVLVLPQSTCTIGYQYLRFFVFEEFSGDFLDVRYEFSGDFLDVSG
jgi:hypothetical protein